MSGLIDLTGRRFGRLVVIERDGTYYSPTFRAFPLWRCRCDCGTECIVLGNSLRQGTTKSCGCLRADITRARNIRRSKGR